MYSERIIESSVSDQDLWKMRDSGDPVAFDLLLERHKGFVIFSLNKYFRGVIEDRTLGEDLEQEALMGLLEAIKKYDPERGIKFSSYATYWIKSYVCQYLSDCSQTVRIPRGVKVAILKILKETPFTDDHLSLKLDSEGMMRARYMLYGDLPFDAEDENNASVDDLSFLGVERADWRDKFISRVISLIETHFPNQKDRVVDMFLNRFGFNENEEFLILSEIAEKHGRDREIVRQNEKTLITLILEDPYLVELLCELDN